MKRFFACLAAFCLCLSCFAVSAQQTGYNNTAWGVLSAEDFSAFAAEKNGGIMTLSYSKTLDDVRDDILNFETEIAVYDFAVPYISGAEEQIYIQAFVNTIVENYPELFFIDSSFSYNVIDGYLYSILPVYKYTQEETEDMLEEYYTYIDNITARMSQEWSELERVIYIHDYLAANYQYDLSYAVRDAYTFFKGRTGVCQGYALAFCALAREVGLECVQIYSKNQNHLWNAVKIDGEFYHVDVTWDDPIYDLTGRVSHKFFLMTDIEVRAVEQNGILRDDATVVGDKKVECTSEKYSSGYEWEAYDKQFVFSNGGWYKLYFEENTQKSYLKKVSSDWQSSKVAVGIGQIYWYASGGGYWPGYFGGIFSIGSTVYANTPSGLWYCDMSADELTAQFLDVSALTGAQQYDIYGSNYDAALGQVILEYKANPNVARGERVVIDVPLLKTSLADALVEARRSVMGYGSSELAPYLDINGDTVIDIRDIVRIKKRLVA